MTHKAFLWSLAGLGLGVVLIIVLVSIGYERDAGYDHTLKVTATAYTSRPSETSGDPYLGAWNNRLTPGEKSIAVSWDLIERGLDNGTKVKIVGLPGTYEVRDKMHRRWRRKIDIYMGNDLKRARKWGKRKVTLRW
jgi:3D (Asp-Asp-Asp) domain-containing protein